MTGITEKRAKRSLQKPFDMNHFTHLFLYAYLASSVLVVIPWIPTTLNTFALYGFVAVGLIDIIIFKRAFILQLHTVWYFLLCVFCLFSCMYSVSFDASLATTIDMVKILVFSFVATNKLNNQKIIVNSMAVYSLATMCLYAYMAMTERLVVEDNERLGEELMGNPNTFAVVFMVAALFSVYFIFHSKRNITKICFFIVFCLQLHTLALSGGRKGFIFPILMFCVMTLVSIDKKGRKHLIRNAIIVVIILLITTYAVFNVEFLYDSIGYRMNGLINLITGDGKVDSSSRIRANMVDTALQLWQRRPIFGNGIDSFKILSSYNTYSHNNYVEILCGLGIFGFCIYYSFYAFAIYKILKQKHFGNYRWYWLLALICFLAFDVGAITYNMFMVQYLFLICVVNAKFKN